MLDEKLIQLMEEILNIDLEDIIFSNPPASAEITKIKVRPVLLKEKLMFQASEFKNKQVFHGNYTKEEFLLKLPDWLEQNMKQVLIRMKTSQISVLISKKGKATIKVTKASQTEKGKNIPTLEHNREKTYILKEGISVPFLVDLGVMTTEGKIVRTKYDKFKQINRFLEFIEDILPSLDKTRELTIIDFGCGKSYLTFAMYYYLKELKGYQIKIIGLDLKKEVIKNCNDLAKLYGFDKLTFLEGDIATFEGVSKVDMVVTLHACDTATDYALYKAVQWEADVILSVPCCQHELNAQIGNDILKPIFQYGLIKERMAALTTDALRAQLLELVEYKTQILEFIDMEHTPKNILIRAVRKSKKPVAFTELNEVKKDEQVYSEKWKAFLECINFLEVKPKLLTLLSEKYPFFIQ
jgi:SAM-dependent methyltransferase